MADLRIRVINWEKFNPRKDVKHPRWFAMSNRIMEDPKLYSLSADEWKAWIYILCQASQEAIGEIDIYFDHMEMSARIPRDSFLGAIAKLENTRVVESVRIRTRSERPRTDTSRDTTLQDITRQKRVRPKAPVAALPLLAALWNDKAKSRPKVERWTKGRAQAAKRLYENQFSDEQWIDACEMVEASDFLSGRNGKWNNCNVDWLLKEANLTKVLEGNYANAHAQESLGAGSMRGA